MSELNSNIKIIRKNLKHDKASEEYVEVTFSYPNQENKDRLWIPTEYRRLGISIKNEEQLNNFLNKVYEETHPDKKEEWLQEQEDFWRTEHPQAGVTKSFFDELAKGGWKCTQCQFPPNNNYARRIQDLKEYGYMIATNKSRYCPHCKKNTSHLILIPIKRRNFEGNGYETFSPKLRKRIIKVLEGIDVYEAKFNNHCLPDHKFSEIRWDNDTKTVNFDNMTDDEIKQKFQLLTNQRNQEKREVCRKCFQTGKRGKLFGIDFYYEGSEDWDKQNYPQKGKEAEKGCVGCPWYDIQRWREELNKVLNKK